MNPSEFGPLASLVGIWSGSEGIDRSPSPSGSTETLYRETLSFEIVGSVINAQQQDLRVVRYLQKVHKLECGSCIHDETGYWMWEPKTDRVMKSTAIPRGVVAVMEGQWQTNDTGMSIDLELLPETKNALVQSSWMKEHAQTTSMNQRWSLVDGELHYEQTTMLKIYGKEFEHTDSNRLRKESP